MKSKRFAWAAIALLHLASSGCKTQQPQTSNPQGSSIETGPAQPATPSNVAMDATQAQMKASPQCYGDWQLAIGKFAELAVSPQSAESWCRSMPLDLSVSIQRNSGGVTFLGNPLQPTDVMHGAGKCEFQFEGPTTGVPEHYTLIVEVPNDASAPGTAKCTAWGSTADGRRTGWGMTGPAKATLTNVK